MTVNEYLGNAPEAIRDTISSAIQSHEAQKTACIDILKANKRCEYNDTELQGMKLNSLQKLIKLSGAAEPTKIDFSLRTNVESVVTEKVEPLGLPE